MVASIHKIVIARNTFVATWLIFQNRVTYRNKFITVLIHNYDCIILDDKALSVEYIVAAGGVVAIILITIVVILICCIVMCRRKKGTYIHNYSYVYIYIYIYMYVCIP